MSGRYVRSLARYGAVRFDERESRAVEGFLELLNDRSYERSLRRGETPEEREARREARRESRTQYNNFIPGMLAYVKRDGTFVVGSDHAEILAELLGEHPVLEEPVTGTTTVQGEDMAYSLCAWPTGDPDIFAVAAVTMYSWVGGNGLVLGRFVGETMLAAFFCLILLILLRMILIRPLQALSSGLRTFKLGQELPAFGEKDGKFLGMQVGEVASLRSSIVELAQKAVEKAELEKRYVEDIVKAQEDERNRLAREIHDGPIQVVAALMQRIQMALLSDPADTQKQLALAEEAAQNVVEDLRGICDSLVPPWVSLGLARCMEEMGNRLARQHDISIDVDVDLFAELSQDKTLALFRIFQEGVSNAVRHGRATHIKLSVIQESSAQDLEGNALEGQESEILVFRLSDDGSGFDLNAIDMDSLHSSGRRGLVGIRQRAESLGGTWNIESAPGEGATVTVRFFSKEADLESTETVS